jgi:hypothetical protein
MAIYCGNNALHPGLVDGTMVPGHRYDCLKKGIGVGRHLPVDLNYLGPYAPLDLTRRYCGREDDLPDGYDDFGTRGDCLRNGVGMGKRMGALDAQKRGIVVHGVGKLKMVILISVFVVISVSYFLALYFTKPDILTKTVDNKKKIDWAKFMFLYIPSLIIVFFIILLVYMERH